MRRRRLFAAAAVAAALLSSGCASARIRRENAVALAAADARVLEGCYDCLRAARATYEQLAASKYVKSESISVRLFETELLLTLREKELGIDWMPALARAKGLAPRLPASVEWTRLLTIVDAVLPDGIGRPNDWPVAMRRERAPFVPRIPGEIAWLQGAPLRPVIRDYVALALDCSYDGRVLAPTRQPGATVRRPVLLPESPPIIIYRTGICLSVDTNMLAAVLATVPAFHEAAYFSGAMAAFFVEEDGGDRAAKLLGQAYGRFPNAPGVTYMSGWLAENIGDCPAALRYFDETIAIDPAHELAMLERTICLSRLRQDTAAITSATQLLALDAGSRADAYYWRAISRLRLKERALARADIEAAKELARSANVLTVAGVIENEQNDLPIAEKDLRAARGLMRGDENCTAAWTLALVLGKAGRPGESGSMFEAAMTCYDIKVSDVRYKLAKLREKPSRNPAYRAKQIETLVADSVDQRSRYFASAFNGAGNHANAGNITRAHQLLDVAALDRKLADPVAKLREAIVAIK